MSKRPKRNAAPKVLLGAERFAGTDAEADAIEKIAAARVAATKEEEARGDNGGPIMDQDAWRRACVEYSAEMLTIEDLESQKAEVAGRISSVRKVAKKLGVDWDVVKRYYEDHKRIRKGAMGAMVTEERRYRQLLKLMDSPLGTQFSLWDVEAEQPEGAAPKPGMDAELQGQASYRNCEPRENNAFQAGSEEYADWDRGWLNAEAAFLHPRGERDGAQAN